MKYTAGEAVVKSLEIEGVEHVFGIIGSAILDVFDLVGRSPHLTFLTTRHEEHAAHMAHAYARAGGKIAVCLVQNGAAVTNLVTGFGTALKAQAPVLGIGGSLSSGGLDSEGRHEVDQLAVMRPVTKWSARVHRADRVPEFLQRAFRVATTPPYGPVFLEIPSDVLHGTFEWEPPVSRNSYRATFQSMVNPEAVAAAATLVRAAQRPLFIVGSEGEQDAAWRVLAAISEAEQIALCSTPGHNSAVPLTPLTLGNAGRIGGSKATEEVVSQADLVVMLGARLEPLPSPGFKSWPAAAKIVQVYADPLQVGRDSRADLGIAADPLAFLLALREVLSTQPSADRGAWRKRIIEANRARLAERHSMATPATRQDGRYLNAAAVYETAGKTLPDAIFTQDVGATASLASSMIDYGQPKGLMWTGTMLGLGFAMPGALGAKLARPDLQVVAMLGDGAFSLSLPALVTAVEYQIPVRILIIDNAAWGGEKAHQLYWYDGNYVGADLKTGDLVEISKAIGAQAVRVHTLEELAHELREEPWDVPKVIVAPTDPDHYLEPASGALGLPARSFVFRREAAGLS